MRPTRAPASISTALGPGADVFHYNHIHLDLANHGSTDTGPRRICKPSPAPNLLPAPAAPDGLPPAPIGETDPTPPILPAGAGPSVDRSPTSSIGDQTIRASRKPPSAVIARSDPRSSALAAEQFQAKPNKSSKITWICLVLFVRIRTFQWVTANPNKKSGASQVCANRLKRSFLSFSMPTSSEAWLVSVNHNTYSMASIFPQTISRRRISRLRSE
jgi:hypothetical protein